MTNKTRQRENRIRKYQRRFEKIVAQAKPHHYADAVIWYNKAQQVAQLIADNMGTTLEVGATILSAFSPNARWAHNVAIAIRYSQGEKVGGLAYSLEVAGKARELGFNALTGLKTHFFARAIAGDENAIVIDLWMIRAAGLINKKTGELKETATTVQYREISQAVLRTSRKIGLSPRDTQALIWCVIRGESF